MEAIIIHPKSKDQILAFEQMAKALKVPFERSTIREESPYDPEFVAMVKQADEDFKKGKGKTVKLDDIWK